MLKNRKCLILLSILYVCLVLVLVAICLFHKCDNEEETITIDLNGIIKNSSNPSLNVYYTDHFDISTRSPVSAEDLVYGSGSGFILKRHFDYFELMEHIEHIEKFKTTTYKCSDNANCEMYYARVHYVIEDKATGNRIEITLGGNDTILVDGKYITLKEEPLGKRLYEFIIPFLLDDPAGRQIEDYLNSPRLSEDFND